MGGTTPRYGFRFPYQTEPVTLTHFKNLADDIDAVVNSIKAKRDDALKRPTLWVQGPSPGTTCAAGTTTTVNLRGSGDFLVHDNDAMSSSGTPSVVTCKTAGIYWLHASVGGISTAVTTLNAFELQINVLGSNPRLVGQHKQNPETFGGNPSFFHTTGVWRLNVNDTVQVRIWWNGSGTTMNPRVEFQARCLALI